jgi:lysophospholipase L1-like esterase
MQEPTPSGDAPFDLIRFALPLRRTAQRVADGKSLKVIAIGSSSTEGTGGTVPYPRLLEIGLSARFPGLTINVLNRGKGGEEAGDELARFQTDVINEDPALVIWQVGTNAVWKPIYDLDQVADSIRAGLRLLGGYPMDVVMIDPQYAPAVIQQPLRAERMVDLIAQAADQASANVFRRFALMAYWNVVERVPFGQMISTEDDGTMLHQNDWSYERVAQDLAAAIADVATRDSDRPT